MLRLLRYLSRHRVRFFRVFRKSIAGEAGPAAPAGIDIRPLAPAEAFALCADPRLDLRPEKLGAAFSRGDGCIAAFRSGRVVAYCWLATAPLPHLDGAWASFPRGTAWIYKSLVLDEERGRRIAPALYRFAEQAAAERGCGASLICVEAHNTASIRAAQSAGYSPAGSAAYVARPALAWHSRGLDRLGVRFRAQCIAPESTTSRPRAAGTRARRDRATSAATTER